MLCLLKNSTIKNIITNNDFPDDLFRECLTLLDINNQVSIEIIKHMQKYNNINDYMIYLSEGHLENYNYLLRLIYELNYSGLKFNLCEYLCDIIYNEAWAYGHYYDLINYINKYINKEILINYILVSGLYSILSYPLLNFKGYKLKDYQILYIYGLRRKLPIKCIHLLKDKLKSKILNRRIDKYNDLIKHFKKFPDFKVKKEIIIFMKKYINIGNLSYKSENNLENIHLNNRNKYND